MDNANWILKLRIGCKLQEDPQHSSPRFSACTAVGNVAWGQLWAILE